MKRNQPITAFYVESLLLIVVFVGILLALTQVFGLSRNESAQASLLTNAVILAENAADELLAEDAAPQGETISRFAADMTPCADESYRLSVITTWATEDGMLQGTVAVLDSRRTEPIYTLPVVKELREVSP